jgi:preprotein translocase subunit SecE
MGVQVSRSSPVQRSENALVRYVKDTRAELGKVTWPTREEGIRLTLIVLAVTIVASIVLFTVDSIFSYLITLFIQAF